MTVVPIDWVLITVDDRALIGRLHLAKGDSMGSIAVRLGTSRNTIAKAVSADRPPTYVRAPQDSGIRPWNRSARNSASDMSGIIDSPGSLRAGDFHRVRGSTPTQDDDTLRRIRGYYPVTHSGQEGRAGVPHMTSFTIHSWQIVKSPASTFERRCGFSLDRRPDRGSCDSCPYARGL